MRSLGAQLFQRRGNVLEVHSWERGSHLLNQNRKLPLPRQQFFSRLLPKFMVRQALCNERRRCDQIWVLQYVREPAEEFPILVG